MKNPVAKLVKSFGLAVEEDVKASGRREHSMVRSWIRQNSVRSEFWRIQLRTEFWRIQLRTEFWRIQLRTEFWRIQLRSFFVCRSPNYFTTMPIGLFETQPELHRGSQSV